MSLRGLLLLNDTSKPIVQNMKMFFYVCVFAMILCALVPSVAADQYACIRKAESRRCWRWGNYQAGLSAFARISAVRQHLCIRVFRNPSERLSCLTIAKNKDNYFRTRAANLCSIISTNLTLLQVQKNCNSHKVEELENLANTATVFLFKAVGVQ